MSKSGLKSKITAGVLFLFFMLILVSVVGYYYLTRLNNEARMVLEDNYESLEYSREMLWALNNWPNATRFETALAKQQENVTEPGEAQVTMSISIFYKSAAGAPQLSPIVAKALRQEIDKLMDLNMRAIVRKNERAGKTAETALVYIAIISGVCLLLGITFVYNFPGYIADPIQKLTEGIKGIANKQYSQRLHFKSGDEFGDLANAFNIMAQRLDEYEHSNLARILFEKQRAEAVVSSLKDATIGFDVNDVVLFANKQALQLLNLGEGELPGRTASEIAQRNDLLRYLVTETSNVPLKIVVDGKESFFTREMADIMQDGQRIGYVIILRNITTFKEQDIAKTHFIATISHELKTPLAASDFSLRLLEDERTGPLSTDQRELLDSLKQDNRRMIKMVSDLLDFSRVESGNIQLQIRSVKPAGIVDYALAAVQRQADEQQVTINYVPDDHLPAITADAEKAAWVLVNLLTNAIRYSPQQGVIQLALQPVDNTLVFSVADNGMGIPVAFQQKIFERFFQVPGMESQKGSGLGLAIAREFIEAQGGKIGVESTEGKGSRFYFSLPLSPAESLLIS
ncbi:ATP-binding protein [Chitinophaga horti]|uniref:histidine kinase n=1 Tax=Chitinophaga horti TaxID=2920382 RepID=A0ABY6J3B0_9BACT|nr:ATP-binding protein [Chitinophaga horti]UYQ92679.1 ATP-binding protein [Chitinophaga horti]